MRNLVGEKMKLGRLTKQEQQRHKAQLNLIDVENKPARDATSFTHKVRPSTGEVIACKWTKQCKVVTFCGQHRSQWRGEMTVTTGCLF